jgi:hypothetical protein
VHLPNEVCSPDISFQRETILNNRPQTADNKMAVFWDHRPDNEVASNIATSVYTHRAAHFRRHTSVEKKQSDTSLAQQ